MGEFRMPSLGADMEYGTLVQWRVKAGDRVQRGDVIAEVETQKGVVEVEIFESGVVEDLVAVEGTRVAVGGVLARLTGAAGAPAEAPPVSPAIQIAAPAAGAAPSVAPPALLPPPAAKAPRASPVARRLARERGIDLASVRGTGPSGAITLADVERATPAAEPTARPRRRATPVAQRLAADLGIDLATISGTGDGGMITKADVSRAATARPVAAAPAPPAAADGARQAAMRQAIAAAVARSNREIPHYYLATDVDMSKAVDWLRRMNLERPVAQRLLPAALLLRAVALALRDVPELNGFWVEDHFRASEQVHVGVAISVRGGGLVAPAIHSVDTLSVEDTMRALRDLVRRARGGGLRSSEITDPTVTVTNLGDLGAQTVFGVIYPPQVALIGFGKIAERPWVEHGMVGSRPVVTATLAADHRASDGHRGGLFLAAVDRLLQTPEAL
jgi:pyruvate dehydrogenase E2 component (dihydrolipoamide acetyltransferase)